MTTRKKKYQEIYESLYTGVDDCIFEGNLDEVIARLRAIKVKYPQHTDITFSLDTEYGSMNIDISLSGKRLETDDDRNDRLAAARMNKAADVERKQQNQEEERAEFFRLHDKYGHLL